jgi:ATP-binding cassette subfamily B protein
VEVSFDGVHFRYPSGSGRGLRGVSFDVPAGTTTALVGTTGAGKTTIGRLLFRFMDPQQGTVKVGGRDVKAVTQASLRRTVGVVPQDTVLFNDTIYHNVLYGKLGASMAEVEAAAAGAQILDFIRSLPEGWETVVGERGLKLSGGEKQRVAIARCLLKDPPVVLLDEATSALDSVTERGVQDALAALGAHRTVLVIAHRLGTVVAADAIVVLGEGAVLERGTHAELLAKRGVYAAMWDMQAKAAQGLDAEAAEAAGETQDEK